MPENVKKKKLLAAKNVVKHFPLKAGGFSKSSQKVHALNSVSFNIYENSTLGIVGESGSGKTTTARTVLRIHEPDSGNLYFNLPPDLMERAGVEDFPENDFFQYEHKKLVKERTAMQYIFQDPYMALNPKMEIKDIVTEPITVLQKLSSSEKEKTAARLLDIVGIPSSAVSKFPHEFSGGQRQRISIARGISTNPRLIICDEPVSSLDVSIQSQIMNLLIELQKEFRISYLFIAHNLAVVFYMSDQVAVMYAGKIVEYCQSRELSEKPLHPYTKMLISVIPEIGSGKKFHSKKAAGEVPGLINLLPGCMFYPRCPERLPLCKEVVPELLDKSDKSDKSGKEAGQELAGQEPHMCACHAV